MLHLADVARIRGIFRDPAAAIDVAIDVMAVMPWR
jgi:hypothetical protein